MTAEELRRLLEQTLPATSYPPWYITALTLGVVALAAFAASFLGAYFKRRGENYATHADFERLLGQLEQQTRATEEIRAQITGALQVRQRKRELQIEAFRDLARLMTEFLLIVESNEQSDGRLGPRPDFGERWHLTAPMIRVLFDGPARNPVAEVPLTLDGVRLLGGVAGLGRKRDELYRAVIEEICT